MALSSLPLFYRHFLCCATVTLSLLVLHITCIQAISSVSPQSLVLRILLKVLSGCWAYFIYVLVKLLLTLTRVSIYLHMLFHRCIFISIRVAFEAIYLYCFPTLKLTNKPHWTSYCHGTKPVGSSHPVLALNTTTEKGCERLWSTNTVHRLPNPSPMFRDKGSRTKSYWILTAQL